MAVLVVATMVITADSEVIQECIYVMQVKRAFPMEGMNDQVQCHQGGTAM
jgi:hypothetical protein